MERPEKMAKSAVEQLVWQKKWEAALRYVAVDLGAIARLFNMHEGNRARERLLALAETLEETLTHEHHSNTAADP